MPESEVPPAGASAGPTISRRKFILSVIAGGAPKPATVKIEGEAVPSRGQKSRDEP